MDLTQAVLEQSRALTSLVAHNSSDPFSDLSSSSSALSSKGAIGRAKLQSELAAHKGVFSNSVIQSMARRMQPALPSEVELSVLRDRGITPTQYLERFGGFGRCKDIGFIIWQVAMCLNHMMEENHAAARYSLSLLFVCLEQTAMDSGNMQVGLLLLLTAGGFTSVPFHEQIHCLGSSSSSFRTNSPSTVGHDCPPVSQRDGHYYQQASRGCWRKTGRRQSSSRLIYDGCELGANPKEKSKGKVRWEGPEESSTPAGGRGDLNKNLIFEEEISYRRLLACLPRWILRTHTGFASFLARTFHIQRNGNSLASAIFPVPVPRLGLFRAQRVPKLSKRKWASLCAQRFLHVPVATV